MAGVQMNITRRDFFQTVGAVAAYAVVGASVGPAQSGQVTATLSWEQIRDADLAGYKVHYITSTGRVLVGQTSATQAMAPGEFPVAEIRVRRVAV